MNDTIIKLNKESTFQFNEKKRLQTYLDKNKKDLSKSEIAELKKQIKKHKLEFEKYDLLTYDALNSSDISELYVSQISKENTRAWRGVRYYQYRTWHTETFENKVRWGIELLKKALERSNNPVVSCSFGIDSIVTLYMTRIALTELGRNPSEIQVIWNDTLNEFPEVRSYSKQITQDWDINLLISKPKKPLKKVIEDHGGIDESYFARKGDRSVEGTPLSEKCCGVLKHEPMKRAIKENNWDLVINGLRADESTQRLRAGLRDGEYFYSNVEWKAFVCRPILWMKEEDIWEYVEKENIPYNDLYNKNMIKFYPANHIEIVNEHKELISKYIDVDKFVKQEILHFTRKQSIMLEKLGYTLYTPRTGCMQCPIPIRYGYLQWMRLTYPKVFNGMVYTLGYGKVLLDMIPDDVKEEIKQFTGIDVTEENADQFLKEILESKPCTFDKF